MHQMHSNAWCFSPNVTCNLAYEEPCAKPVLLVPRNNSPNPLVFKQNCTTPCFTFSILVNFIQLCHHASSSVKHCHLHPSKIQLQHRNSSTNKKGRTLNNQKSMTPEPHLQLWIISGYFGSEMVRIPTSGPTLDPSRPPTRPLSPPTWWNRWRNVIFHDA